MQLMLIYDSYTIQIKNINLFYSNKRKTTQRINISGSRREIREGATSTCFYRRSPGVKVRKPLCLYCANLFCFNVALSAEKVARLNVGSLIDIFLHPPLRSVFHLRSGWASFPLRLSKLQQNSDTCKIEVY